MAGNRDSVKATQSEQQPSEPAYTAEEKEWLKENWGGEYRFLRAYELSIYKEEDREEGRAIVRAFIEADKSEDAEEKERQERQQMDTQERREEEHKEHPGAYQEYHQEKYQEVAGDADHYGHDNYGHDDYGRGDYDHDDYGRDDSGYDDYYDDGHNDNAY